MNSQTLPRAIVILFMGFACSAGMLSCSDNGALAYEKNTPTSGDLIVFYDEGLGSHVLNQAYTFEALYPRVNLHLHSSTEDAAIQALYTDSCEAIVVSRLLNPQELRAFASRNYTPKYSLVARTGLALITSSETALHSLSVSEVKDLVTNSGRQIHDESGKILDLGVVFAGQNSACLHYVLDTLLKSKKLSPNCSILNSSTETINYVANHKNTIGVINYAWLSDSDDSLYKANTGKLCILAIGQDDDSLRYLPDPSNFKLGTYPFTQNIYVIRKQGDFTLAKGFESFVMGPKGQLTFLKQGLLPGRQGERSVHIKTSQ